MQILQALKRILIGEKELTLGECRKRSLHIVSDCQACGTQTLLDESDLPMKDSFEVRFLNQTMRCPNCGNTNKKDDVQTRFFAKLTPSV
jgi:hypothetical protein